MDPPFRRCFVGRSGATHNMSQRTRPSAPVKPHTHARHTKRTHEHVTHEHEHKCINKCINKCIDGRWSLRLHDDAVVRRGALVALCTVAEVALPTTLGQDIDLDLDELQAWLRATATQDPDEGCRRLAAICHQQFGQALRSELGPGV